MRTIALLLGFLSLLHADQTLYQPAQAHENVETKLTEFTYNEREVPLKIYFPKKQSAPAPVILLSHGLGGSREIGSYLGEHWAGRGYVVVAMQHLGSDSSVWQGQAPEKRMAALRKAANGKTFLDRTRDVPATLDQLEKWHREKNHFLHDRLDLDHIGIGGHSYGAVTTQALAGQHFGAMGAKFADSRLDAALALSPSPPNRGSAQDAFGKVSLPMMLMTGTKDRSAIGRTTPESRREVFAALPKGSKYELVLKDAEHMAFSDHTMRGQAQRNPNHHKVITALSSAFWDATLKGNHKAKAWLESDAPKKLLEAGDHLQLK